MFGSPLPDKMIGRSGRLTVAAGCSVTHPGQEEIRPTSTCANQSCLRYGPRPSPPSRLDPFKAYLEQRRAEDMFNAHCLLHELRALGDTGGETILKDYPRPRRPAKTPRAAVPF